MATTETAKMADEIRTTLDGEHCITLTRGREKYFISEDEEVTGWFAWHVPTEQGEPPVASFGDCDLTEDDTPDYRALSERIAEWITQTNAKEPADA